jgi:hypothetical protein
MAGWSSSNTYSQVGPISLHADHQTDTTVSLISGTARPTVHYRPTTPVSRPLETWVPLVNREQRNAPYVRQRARLSCGERVVSQQNPAVWGGVCRNSTPCSPVGGRRTDGLKIPPSASPVKTTCARCRKVTPIAGAGSARRPVSDPDPLRPLPISCFPFPFFSLFVSIFY